MKIYPIGNSSTETIDFRANDSQDDNQYALVHWLKSSPGDTYKTIIMNRREVLLLYRAIQDEIFNGS